MNSIKTHTLTIQSGSSRSFCSTRDRPEVPEYAAASFWCIFDFYTNGNCRLGRTFPGTYYLLRVFLLGPSACNMLKGLYRGSICISR